MNIKGIHDLSSELKKLETFWTNKYSNRSRGGRIAISGFRYQFYLFLINLINEWLSYSKEERNNIDTFQTKMEELSDIITISKNGVIIATQSKITLRSSSLIDSLEEFKTIHLSALEVCPQLIKVINYRILSSKTEVIDIQKDILNWKSKQQKTNDSTLDFLDSIQILTESTPENNLLSILVNNFKCIDPIGIIYKWLGLLIDGIPSTEVMSNVGRTIWSDLVSFLNRVSTIKDNLYIWQDSDISPDSVLSGSVLIGQRPSVYHLRKGYFSTRTKVYNDLENNLLAIIDYKKFNHSDKISTFWIGGRSGSGKSVALLHLLSSLNEKGYGPIVWIGHQTNLLCSAMKFALESGSSTKTPIIGIDDPYVVGVENNVSQYWEEVFALLHVYRQNGDFEHFPIIVACGPTEQAYLFKQDYYEFLDFNINEIPQESNEERQELKLWYYHRTGNEPPDIDDINTLMVQLFFQWHWHEPIIDFSIRLKERLIISDTSKGLFDLVSRILSLNRLYVGYPSAAIRNNLLPEQKDLLKRLEDDLHFGERESNGTNGYWLLHAHLANALYLNWFENKPSSIIEYLKLAIIDSYLFGDNPSEKTAPLWAISRVFRKTGNDELCKRINEKAVIALLKDIYLFLQKDFKSIPISILPVWVEIYSLKPEILLQPSPINLAIEAILSNKFDETGLRLLCHKLMQHYHLYDYRKQLEIKDTIIKFLSKKQSWNIWLPIMKNALFVLKDLRLLPVIQDTISGNLHLKSSSELLYLSLKEWPNNRILINIVINNILNVPCSITWIDIIKEIIKSNDDDLSGNIVKWFEVNKGNKFLFYALKEAIQKYYGQVRETAIFWANTWYNFGSASFVLETLLENDGGNEDIVNLCLKWAQTVDIDKSFMLEKLLHTKNVSPEIIETAVNWLNNIEPQNPSWFFVWKALNNLTSVNIPSLSLGINWLNQNNPNKPAWPYIWRHLNKINKNNSILFDLGLKWLIHSSADHILWKKILITLLHTNPENIELRALRTTSLLPEDLTDKTWPYLWQYLFIDDRKNTDLINSGIKWLKETCETHPSWIYIWNHIINNIIDDTELFNKCINCLSVIDINHNNCRIALQNLMRINITNQELIKFSLKWLQSVDYKISGWEHVWQKLYKSNLVDKNIVLNIGKIWIYEIKQNHGGWISIWDSIYKADLSDINLYNLGFNYLRTLRFQDGAWANIWLLLSKANPDDDQIVKYGLRWISNVDIKKSIYCSIWMRLVTIQPKNNQVFVYGKKWLASNSFYFGSWQEFFVKFADAYPNNREFTQLGLLWLEKNNFEHSSWINMWIRLIKQEPNNISLIEQGYKYLKQSEEKTKIWPSIWVELIAVYPKDDLLLNLALEWISENLIDHPYWDLINNIIDKETS